MGVVEILFIKSHFPRFHLVSDGEHCCVTLCFTNFLQHAYALVVVELGNEVVCLFANTILPESAHPLPNGLSAHVTAVKFENVLHSLRPISCNHP